MINAKSVSFTGTNNFTGLNGTNGAAFYISLDLNTKALFGPLTYSFTGLNITNCYASNDGGAMYLKNIYNMNIINSIINNNQAVKNGGGI